MAPKAEEEVVEAAPEMPAMPSMSLSQIVPMVVMLGLNKFDLDEMGLRRHTEIGYVIVQLLCLGAQYLLYQKIEKMPADGPKIKVAEVKQMGQVVSEACEQSTKDYDKGKFGEQLKQAVMGFCILGGIYYKWQYLMPLVLQIIMTPLQLYESPLVKLHLMGKLDVRRPFPAPNPFGLPSAPEAPAPAVEAPAAVEAVEGEETEGDEKKDGKKKKGGKAKAEPKKDK